MISRQFALFKPGGRVARAYSYGKLTETRYLDVIRMGVESADRDDFIKQVEALRLSDEQMDELRIGYVDENDVGLFYDWQEFLDMQPQTA